MDNLIQQAIAKVRSTAQQILNKTTIDESIGGAINNASSFIQDRRAETRNWLNGAPAQLPMGLQTTYNNPVPTFSNPNSGGIIPTIGKNIFNFGASIPNSIFSPVATSGVDLLQNTSRAIGGKPLLNYDQARGGLTRTAMQLSTLTKPQNTQRYGINNSAQEVIGNLAEPANALFNVATMGEGGPIANLFKMPVEQGLKQMALRGLKVGAVEGGTMGLLGGLQNNRTNTQNYLQSVAGETAGGALMGGALGGALGAGTGVYKTLEKSYQQLGFKPEVATQLAKKHFVNSDSVPVRLPSAQTEYWAKINSVLNRPLNTPVFSDDLKAYVNKVNGIPNTQLSAGFSIKSVKRDGELVPAFKPPYQRGDKANLTKQLDELLQTKDFNMTNYRGELPARQTAMNMLESAAKETHNEPVPIFGITPAEARARLSKVKYLEDQLANASIVKDGGAMPKTNTTPIKTMPEGIQTGTLPTKVSSLTSEKLPKIVRPAKVDIQSQRVLKPNKLDSTSEQIIHQARQQIGTPVEPKQSLKQKFDEIYTNWVDRYHPLVKLTEGITNLDPQKNPKYVIRRFLGAGSIAEQRFNTELKPVLDTIDKLKIDKTDLDAYLINKRNVGFGEIGRKVKGSNPAESAKVIQALEAKYGTNISGIADQLYSFQNKGLDEMVNAGFISKESANAMRGQNPNYAPFQRVMDELDDYIGLPTKKAMQGTQPIKKLEGSDRKILSPVESIIANIFSQRAAIEKNNVAKSVAGLNDAIPGLGFKKVSAGGDSTITIWKNGVKEHWEVGNDIAKAMKGMNEESTNSFMKILTAPANLLRQGATGRNPEFMLPNIVRDQLDAAVNSKYGYKPFVDYVKGLAHIVKNDDVYNQWMESGGAQSFGSISGRKSISEMFDKSKARKGLFSWLGAGLDVMGKYSEQPTRVGLFANALKKGASGIEAAYESREGTMDFARMGAKMKVANSIIPFLNVQVQGFDKMLRNFKDAPGKTTLKMGLYGAAPAAIVALYNQAYHPTEYSEIPQFVKDDNFILVKGRNEKGTVDYVAIPKGNLIRLVTNPVEHFVNYLAGNEKTTFGEMVTQLLSSNLPLLGEGSSPQEVAIKTIGQNIPQAIKPITENLLNKSFYKYDAKKEQSKEIVPYYLNKLPAGEQAYKFTPALYKGIGRVLNVSPLQVQNLMEGYLAGFIKIPANIVDDLKNISEGKEPEQNKIPILRRFIQETYPTTDTKPAPKPEASPIIPQAMAADENMLQKITNVFKPKPTVTPEQTLFEYKDTAGATRTIDTAKINSMPTTSNVEALIKRKEAYKLVDDVYKLPQEQQAKAFSQLGISQADAQYYRIANNATDVKEMFVKERLTQLAQNNGSHDDMLKTLIGLRYQVNGQMIATDSVLKSLYDENLLTTDEYKELKNLKVTNGGIRQKSLRAKKGRKPAFKKVKMGSLKKIKVPKLRAIKLKKIKLNLPKFKTRAKLANQKPR